MVAQADLAIDIQTGAIQALILPVRSSWFKKGGHGDRDSVEPH